MARNGKEMAHKSYKTKGKRTKKLSAPPVYKSVSYSAQEDRIKSAITALKDPHDLETTTVAIAARIFKIPYSTLRDRLHGAGNLSKNGAHNANLNEGQEALLIEYCDTAIALGHPLNYGMITAAATKILRSSGYDMDGKDRLGINWTKNWVQRMNRKGRYHGVRTKPMDYRRKNALTPTIVRDYFERLRICIKEHEIHTQDIYNADETGFMIGCISSTVVVTHKNVKNVYTKDPRNRESITVMECISAGGWAINCFIIMPGRVFKEKMFDNNLPANTKIRVSEKGYTDDETALQWLWHFHNETKGRMRGRYRLLILDGHQSHLTYEFLSTAESLDIICFCLLAHSTHFTQPLDVACFQIEKHWHNRSIEDKVRAGELNFSKYTFLQVLNQIREKTFTQRAIRSAFRRAGVVPHNPERVLAAMKLTDAPTVGATEVGGRIYNHDPSDPSQSIRVPASNSRTPVIPHLENGTSWDESAGEDDYQYYLNRFNESDWEDSIDDDFGEAGANESAISEHFPGTQASLDDDITPDPCTPPAITLYPGEETHIASPFYKRDGAPFLQTPRTSAGIHAHAKFLQTYEYEMSSPSRQVSKIKFYKGSEILSLKADIAMKQLAENSPLDTWGSQNLFLSEENVNRHVPAASGGKRLLSHRDAVRSIQERVAEEAESAIEKLERESKRVALALQNERDKAQKDFERAQKKLQKIRDGKEKLNRKAERKASAAEKKRKKEEDDKVSQEAWVRDIEAGISRKGRVPASVKALYPNLSKSKLRKSKIKLSQIVRDIESFDEDANDGVQGVGHVDDKDEDSITDEQLQKKSLSESSSDNDIESESNSNYIFEGRDSSYGEEEVVIVDMVDLTASG